jgi:hypothetical protein
MQQEVEYSQRLHHMDRICFGNGALFQFRYPLMKYKIKQVEFALVASDADIDADEMDRQIEIKLE